MHIRLNNRRAWVVPSEYGCDTLHNDLGEFTFLGTPWVDQD